MRRVLFLLASALALVPAISKADCDYEEGEARWAIKTSVVTPIKTPKAVSLKTLIELDNPPVDKNQKRGLETGRLPKQPGWTLKEGDIISTTGIVDHIKCNKDGDFHVQLRTADDTTKCLIVEVIDPSQAQGGKKSMVALYDQVRRKLDSKVLKGRKSYKPKPNEPPIELTVSGQLFYDAHHFQKKNPGGSRGIGECKATNLWEIHPVTKLE